MEWNFTRSIVTSTQRVAYHYILKANSYCGVPAKEMMSTPLHMEYEWKFLAAAEFFSGFWLSVIQPNFVRLHVEYELALTLIH